MKREFLLYLCIFWIAGYTSVDDLTWESAAKIKRHAPEKLAKFLREQRERRLGRPGVAAKAKKTRQDSESDTEDEDEQGNEDGDDDGSGTGSADEDDGGAPTAASKSEQPSPSAAAKNSIVCASLLVAPSCIAKNCIVLLLLIFANFSHYSTRQSCCAMLQARAISASCAFHCMLT
jgi:hypothetical protein